MEIIFKKNEAEINESVAKGLLIVFSCTLIITLLCWFGIFDIYASMIIIFMIVSFITLVVPAFLIIKMHIYHSFIKYYVVAGLSIMAGITYVLFTFQAVLVFIVPVLLAAFYLDKRLLYFSGLLTIIVLFISHIITGFYMFQPWLEPFIGMNNIIRYGALPRSLQYCGCFFLVFFMMDRYKKLILHFLLESDLNVTNDIDFELKKEYDCLLEKLTEREKEIFLLMIGGYTNIQIANKLYLSNGTVKNYISVIYEKIETRDRNALILKYNCFLKNV